MTEPAPQRPTPGHPAGAFDDQAGRFDERAGIPPEAGTQIARSIVNLADAEAGDLVAEIGAGTGEIGVHLLRTPIRYVGLDASGPMLQVFRDKAVHLNPSLALADCNDAWPLADGTATVIFASRVIHLLDPHHVTRETLRAGSRGGFMMIGRVLRDPDSVKERLRRKRQELLIDAGLSPRNGAAGTRRVVELLQDAGADALGRQVVASWNGEVTAAGIMAGWEALETAGSVSISPDLRNDMLANLRAWAKVEIGDLDRAEAFRERYALELVRLP